MNTLPSTRKKAAKIGSKFYFTGKPCHQGMVAKRLTSVGRCYCEKCLESVRAGRVKSRNKRVDYYRSKSSEYKSRNKDRINAYFRDYKSKNKVSFSMRSFITYSMKRIGVKKYKSSLLMTGYTVSDFKHHIEKLFDKGMSWENYGEWHIDHIKPIKAFIDEGTTDPAIINALDNLQPLWAGDNFAKGANYDEPG